MLAIPKQRILPWRVVDVVAYDQVAIVHVYIREQVIANELGNPAEFILVRTPEGITRFLQKVESLARL